MLLVLKARTDHNQRSTLAVSPDAASDTTRL
jgi:hypothetical protein